MPDDTGPSLAARVRDSQRFEVVGGRRVVGKAYGQTSFGLRIHITNMSPTVRLLLWKHKTYFVFVLVEYFNF